MSQPTHLGAVRQNAQRLRERGDLAGARSMLEHALRVASTAYGAAHPEVLETARLLAGAHREAGDLAAARRTLETAIAAGQLSLPEEEPLMLLLTRDLATVADEFGNRHEARRNMSIVARLGPVALGPDHPAVRAAVRYLDPETVSTPAPSPLASSPSQPPPAPPAPPPPAPAAPTTPPARSRVGGAHQRPRQRRTPIVIVAVIAVAATAAAALAVWAGTGPVVAPPTTPLAAPPTTPSATPPASWAPPAGLAPTEVRLRDTGTSITVTWHDPSGGAVPFIVAVARPGEQARPLAQLPAGRTSYTANGLNPRLEYCFTVAAVYSTDTFPISDLVCTRRGSHPQPTRS